MRRELLQTKKIVLRPWGKEDLDFLWMVRNSDSYRRFCSAKRDRINYSDFVKEFGEEIKGGVCERFIIIQTSTGERIGTIYSYGFNRADSYIFVTTYIAEKYEGLGYGVDAFLLFVEHVFSKFNMFKVYLDVYSFNVNSLGGLRKWGMVEEGRFAGHRLFEGERCDLIRLSLFSTQLPKIQKYLKRLGR